MLWIDTMPVTALMSYQMTLWNSMTSKKPGYSMRLFTLVIQVELTISSDYSSYPEPTCISLIDLAKEPFPSFLHTNCVI